MSYWWNDWAWSVEDKMKLKDEQIDMLVNDMKKQVNEQARATLEKVMALTENEDIKPFLPVLKSCLIQPKDLLECIHKLAGTTFVQVLTAPMLAVVCPVLISYA